MCLFFKKPKTKDVQQYFYREWKNTEMPGFPPKSSRNYENFKQSPYDTLNKTYCSASMKVKCGKWDLDYKVAYNRKENKVYLSVWYFNLTLPGADLQRAVNQTFKNYKIGYWPSAVTITSKDYTVKKISDIENAFHDIVREWKESGIYNFMDNFKTNEELKKK
ncbi:MAG: hypothetical protein IJA97_01465 [Clostridia bacterium]|nr:hypothetical protein [Clostridia bacterium]